MSCKDTTPLKRNDPLVLLVTWCGSGLSPKMSGTCGTLAALPFAYVIQTQLGMVALSIAALLAFFIGWVASNRYMALTNKSEDPQEIVIDEVAGIWLVIAAMPLMWLGPSQTLIIELYIAAFVAFRLFDGWKPWPVSWADCKVKGGLGVMLDDILAAVYALIALGALGHLAGALGLIHIDLGHPHV